MSELRQREVEERLAAYLEEIESELPTADGFGLPADSTAARTELDNLLGLVEHEDDLGERAELLYVEAAVTGDAALRRDSERLAAQAFDRTGHPFWRRLRWHHIGGRIRAGDLAEAEDALRQLISRLRHDGDGGELGRELNLEVSRALQGCSLVLQKRFVDGDLNPLLVSGAALAMFNARWWARDDARRQRALTAERDRLDAWEEEVRNAGVVRKKAEVREQRAAARRQAEQPPDAPTKVAARADVPLRRNVPPAELPAAYAQLLDPERPLPRPERYVHAPLSSLVGNALHILLALFLSVSFLAIGLAQAGGQSIFAFALLLPSGLYVAWGAKRFGHARRQREDVRAGRFRRGFFVERDAIVFFDGTAASLLPRDRVEHVGSWTRGSGKGMRSQHSYLGYRDDDGELEAHRLPGVTPLQELHRELDAWIRTGEFQRSLPPTVDRGVALRSWLHHIVVGHLALNLVGVVIVAVSVAISTGVGELAGKIVGLLLAAPMFLVFPIALGGLLTDRSKDGVELPGGGYIQLLGFAVMVLGIAGGATGFDTVRFLVSPVIEDVSLAEIGDYRDRSAFLQLTGARVRPGPLGYHHRSSRIGETVQHQSYYVLPLAPGDEADSSWQTRLERGEVCVWLGLVNHDVSKRAQQMAEHARLGHEYYIEVTWMREAFVRAVHDAIGFAPRCEVRIFDSAASPEAAIAGALYRLLLLVMLCNLVPLVLLVGYFIWQLDRPPGYCRVDGAGRKLDA